MIKTVFAHGVGQSAEIWHDVLNELGDNVDPLVPDLFSLPNVKPEYDSLYQAFCTYCDSVEEPITLCGLSLGALLALHYASEHPEKVERLALINGQYHTPLYARLLQNILFAIMPKAAFEQMHMTKAQVIHLTQSIAKVDLRKKLCHVQCPTLLIVGEKDQANLNAAQELSEILPKSTLRKVGGAQRIVRIESPKALASILQASFKN